MASLTLHAIRKSFGPVDVLKGIDVDPAVVPSMVDEFPVFFIAAAKARGIPAAICATLPENIDPKTRDVVQDIYIREVKDVGGQLYNVEFATYPKVRDPNTPAP